MNRQRFLLPALLVLTVARLLILPQMDLSAVEQHVVACAGQDGLWHPGLGPLLPLLVKLSTAVFGTGAFGVRFFAPWLILGAGWLLWELSRGMFDATTASWAVVIFHLTPAVNAASVTLTQTTVGITVSVAALAALRHALHRRHPLHLEWWLLGGTLVLGFLADWRLIMATVSVTAGMALTARGRRALMKWPVLPVLSICLGAALTFFLAWNSEHDWIAFTPMPLSQPVTSGTLILHSLLAGSPLLLAAHGWSLTHSALHKPLGYTVSFVYAFTWPLVTLDLLSWSILPWPQCGFGAWTAPAAMLLAHLSLTYERVPPKTRLWLRWMTLLSAAVQSCWMMREGLGGVTGLAW